ncbi:MAG: FtsX-like permease family protein [Gemmatimonadetes bacterium]|nr:ABC transporter permease [Gemmatimonadota bacterium]NIQ58602.1 ABC transporter permease [Gemmatimonadota bacterium]NIU78792.1 FtsX-like permease family protein [Gammaproteobacteria bacterium]NIX47605.1 FtsX-like permease family protein [Gemmatimonadota bacterium]NIY11964.1 FtsX-like permease family protein [Gemmatimonadota bacterium]
MSLREAVRLAFAQIRAQKLKSFFSVVGVIIGVMFLIAVISIVEGMNRYMEEDFAKTIYGLNTVTVTRTPSVQMNTSREQWREWRRRPRLELGDAEAIRQLLSVPAEVAVESYNDGRARSARGEEVSGVWLTAASADFFRIREMSVARGRLFGPLEDEAGLPVVVLGSETADKLFGPLDPLGRTIRIDNVAFEVIGVLEPQGTLFGMSLDNRAIAPARSPMARLTNPGRRNVVDQILVKADDPQALGAVQLELEAIMRVRHRLRPDQPNSFEIETKDDSMQFWQKLSRILFIAFPGLVGIALVVGGMVIMNIMLMSVVERTREIGMRKAVGARRRDILLQILVESSALSFAGAAIGIGLGLLLAEIIEAVSPMPAAVGYHWLAIAAAMGIVVGVIAGLYPASRASRLDPVVALRAE